MLLGRMRYIFVFTNTPPFPPLKGEAKVITAGENKRFIFVIQQRREGDPSPTDGGHRHSIFVTVTAGDS